MSYSIKNLKTMQGMEGVAYSCTLYRDGVKVAECIQDGRGGCTHFRFINEDERKALDAFCAALPHESSEYDSELYAVDADMYVARLADEFEMNKKLRSWCKKKTVFRLPADKPGEYRTISQPFAPKLKEWLVAKYGKDVEIVNETVGA